MSIHEKGKLFRRKLEGSSRNRQSGGVPWRQLLAILLLSLSSTSAQVGSYGHAVMLSAAWQDDTGDLARGATVSLLFQRGTVHGGPYVTVGTVPVTQASRLTYSYVDQAGPSNPLPEGQTYYYVVMAQDNSGNMSPVAPEISVVIPTSVNGYHKTASAQ